MRAYLTKAQQSLALRRFRQRESLRIGYNDIVRGLPLEVITCDLSDLADACVEGALRLARARAESRYGVPRTSLRQGRPGSSCWAWESWEVRSSTTARTSIWFSCTTRTGGRAGPRWSRTPSSLRGWEASWCGCWSSTLRWALFIASTCDCARMESRGRSPARWARR